MNGTGRRERILDALRAESGGPVPGAILARRLGVSRQAIVHDVAILRAAGRSIIGTAAGYVLGDDLAAAAPLSSQAPGSSPGLEPLRAPSLADLAYQQLRDAVLTGQAPMGSRLIDMKLAEELRVSRGTVRQALTRLIEEGLATERPRQGVFVRTFVADDLISLYNVRVAIEPVAARLIVRRRAPLAQLRELLEVTGRAYRSGDVAAILDAESEFHLELVRLGGNEHLLDLYRAARSRFRMAISLTQTSLEPDMRVATDDHPPIVAALETGDERRAAQVVHWHIVEFVDEALRRLGAAPDLLLQPFDLQVGTVT
jgi:DNA-binding GntR family transcriptional regulator